MEYSPSSDFTPLDHCRRAVLSSDVLILLVGRRYGWVPPGRESSIQEIEFEAARENGIPVLAFVLDEDYPLPPESVDHGDSGLRLVRFKQRLLSELTVSHFTSPSDLQFRVASAIHDFLSRVGDKVAPDAAMIKIEDHLAALRPDLAEVRVLAERSSREGRDSVGLQGQPAAFLGRPASHVDENRCFIAMPYSTDWSIPLEKTLVEICAACDMTPVIAKHMGGRFIPNDIWQGITGAAVVVADITGGNPNVAYEVGLADVLGKEVVLLCQGDKVPFDFLGQRLICYENSMAGPIALREELVARFRALREKRRRGVDSASD